MTHPRHLPLCADALEHLEHTDPLAAQVWTLSDGTRSVAEIATALSLPADHVWSALDRLADRGALTRRAAPPAAAPHPALISRRDALSKLALGALGATALLSSRSGWAQDTKKAQEEVAPIKEADEAPPADPKQHKTHQEQRHKEEHKKHQAQQSKKIKEGEELSRKRDAEERKAKAKTAEDEQDAPPVQKKASGNAEKAEKHKEREHQAHDKKK